MIFARFLVVIAVVFWASFGDCAEANHATFPENFDVYVLYASYDRGASKEEAFATPATLALARAGKELPPGTQPSPAGNDDHASADKSFVISRGSVCNSPSSVSNRNV